MFHGPSILPEVEQVHQGEGGKSRLHKHERDGEHQDLNQHLLEEECVQVGCGFEHECGQEHEIEDFRWPCTGPQHRGVAQVPGVDAIDEHLRGHAGQEQPYGAELPTQHAGEGDGQCRQEHGIRTPVRHGAEVVVVAVHHAVRVGHVVCFAVQQSFGLSARFRAPQRARPCRLHRPLFHV
eukprot:scaffold1431_cov346-Pavlova_lutheri.AAC.7